MGELVAILGGVALLGALLIAIPIGRMAVEFAKSALQVGRTGPRR